MNQVLREFPLCCLVIRLTSCLGILALAVSPAQAQLYGPGPSPSDLFDIVLNLPGDDGEVFPLLENNEIGVAFQSTQLNVAEGGFVNEYSFGMFSTEVNINGGYVAEFFYASCEVNITGGTVANNFICGNGGVVNISGGVVGDAFTVTSTGFVNIQGTAFFINGIPLNNLQPGTSSTIIDRNVTLSGLLADGQPFSFELNTSGYGSQDFFGPNATLTVTLVSPVVTLGDVNLDGVVDFWDINPFIGVLSAATFQAEADCDENGVVNFLDINYFIGILSGN